MDNGNLWTQYKKKPEPELKKKLIQNYLKLVHYVIHKSNFASPELLDERDYFQFGIEGLSEAIDRFDPGVGTKFETYAIQRIKGKIIDELRKLKLNPKIFSSDGKEQKYYSRVSLTSSIDEDESCLVYETIPDNTERPDESLQNNEAKEILFKAIKELNERDRLIISLYYYEELNYKEIAEVLNITVSRVSQVHTKIIKELKSRIAFINA
jgi:RNA polymerase sigma factor for flagellar operon FliA